MLRRGETIEITRRGKLIGRLEPAVTHPPLTAQDIMARLHRIYGNKVLKVSNVELLRWDRGDRMQPRSAVRKRAPRSRAVTV